MERLDVTFRSGHDALHAWLYRPAVEGSFPLVVMAHGLGAVKAMGLAPYAERFVEAGFGALVFDYRGFGESGGEPRQWLDVKRQLEDWQAAVDFAHTIDGVDTARIAIWGSSFGGGHVIRTAARDRRVAAAIAQCPFTDGLASLRALGPRSAAKLMPTAFHDLVAGRSGKARRVPIVNAPGTKGLMTAPDAEPGYLALVPEGSGIELEVDGRIALHVPRHSPGRAAKNVRCPILFSICEKDTVAPPGPTAKYAAQAPRGEVKHYPIGHFDIYDGDGFERAVTDYVDFLKRHLG